MPIPKKYLADFTEGNLYHVYNRTNNKEKLFLNDDNRKFFLYQYAKYVGPVTEIYCWTLLSNHFHFLIRIKSQVEIVNGLHEKVHRVSNFPDIGSTANPLLTKTENRFLKKEINLNELIVFYFKSLFQSYSQAFNKVHNRKGNLFYKPFKRVAITDDSHFTKTIVYIHANAQHHKICKDFTKYKWSSWHSLLSKSTTLLKRNEILDWFGGLEPFIYTHKTMTAYYYDCGADLEDD